MVKSEFAIAKLSFSGILLFYSLPNDLKMFNDHSPSAYTSRLKTFFHNLNHEVDHFEHFSCSTCSNIVKFICYTH